MKRIKLSNWFGWSLLALAILLGGVAPVQAAGEIGKTIDRSNVQEYKDLLNPALYRAIERGDFICPTANLDFEYKHDAVTLAAAQKNAGRFDVNAPGDLIEKSTGKIPTYNVYGFPFPNIDKNDPNVAVKIMWNFNFMKYRFMGTHSYSRVAWVDNTEGEHRFLLDDEYNLYYQNRPPGEEFKKNPNNYLLRSLVNMIAPMSMKGTGMLIWDYLDPRDITVYAYVPAFRRIRQTSGAARSDPYQGTDAWTDMTYGWEGKNRTMTWKLVGEKTILVPLNSIKKVIVEEKADGSMVMPIPDAKWVWNTPGSKGAKWAPTGMTWVPRKVWVIEQMPKDPYYAWGLHVNYVDKENYIIWMKEVSDKAGQFRTWAFYGQHYTESSKGKTAIGAWETVLYIDEIARHATTVHRDKEMELFIPSKRLSSDFYTVSNFLSIVK